MKDLTATPVSSLPAPRTSLYESLFLKVLQRLGRGGLRVRFPDGSARSFGSGQDGPSAAIEIRDADFFRRCVLYGDIGLAEAYLDGLWETDSISRVIAWAIANIEDRPGEPPRRSSPVFNVLQFLNRISHLLRPNSSAMSRRNISEHYDLGNEFYRLWLDPTMTYSSAYFTVPGQSLESAQSAKYDRLCRQLRLAPGDEVLEIGCGWGGFAEHAAKHYGCRVTGITLSPEQCRFARERLRRAGLDGRADIQLEDYRNLTGRFDKIVSIEMMEALGDRYLPVFFAQIHRLLKPDGLVGLQYITVPDCRHAKLRRGVDFIQKHIFPGSLLLSIGRVNEAVNRTGDLFLHDLKDLGLSYAQTLREWGKAFNAREAEVRALGFDTRFIRKWNYYLQYCEAAFAARNISVVQAIYTRPLNPRLP